MKLVFSFLIFLYGSFALLAQGDQLFTPAQIKEDLALVKRVVYEAHPRAFQWFPKDSFDLWFQEAESKVVKEMTQLEFQQLIFKIYKKIGCGHSRVRATQSVVKARGKDYKKGIAKSWLPLQIISFEDSLFVRKYFNQDSLLHKGDQILSIDGQTPAELIHLMSGFITSDGYNDTHIAEGINKNFQVYYHRFFPFKEKYQIDFIDSLGEKKSLAIPGQLKSKSLDKDRRKKLKKNPPPRSNNVSEFNTILIKGGYKFSRSKRDSSLVVLRIPSFAGGQGKKFYKKVFALIEADKSIKALAVDLRQNGGGDASESFMLSQILNTDSIHFELKRRRHLDKAIVKEFTTGRMMIGLGTFFISRQGKSSKDENYRILNIDLPIHKKYNYDGPLYMLIDGYSFSASAVVASFLKDSKRAIFIGEETGGGYHGTNAMQSPNLTLPNTSVQLRVPLWSLDQLVSAPKVGHGIYPNYPTTWNSQHVFEKIDPDMEVLYELLKK